MSAAPELATDLIRLGQDGDSSLEPTYTAGVSDPIGDRLICFATPGAAAVELLRFKPELADAPGFEAALRSSVEALGRLDPSLATVRAVQRVEDIDGLALVSVRESGRPLSELMPRAHGAAYAVELVREIGPALALLHRAGHAHGALTPERIIVSRAGHPIVLEHVLGAALGALALPGPRLRALAGVAVPDGDGPLPIEPRLDVIQLGLIALSLLVGRRLMPAEFPGRIGLRLEEFSSADPETAARLRPWLERALQIGAQPFTNAADALAAFPDLPDALLSTSVTRPAPEPPSVVPAPVAAPVTRDVVHPVPSHTTTYLRWAAAAAGIVVVVVGLIVPTLTRGDEATDATTPANALAGSFGAPPVAETPPADLGSPASEGTNDAAGAALLQGQPDAAAGSSPAATPPAEAAGPGRVRIDASIELQVIENETPVGTTAGPLMLSAGPHTLDVVNEEFGFRARQTVDVRGGRLTVVRVALPNGRLDVNAAPWADVWIDGVSVGQTPLANLTQPIGRHEVIFRHPELGERREVVVVKVDGIARVSAAFQQ